LLGRLSNGPPTPIIKGNYSQYEYFQTTQ